MQHELGEILALYNRGGYPQETTNKIDDSVYFCYNCESTLRGTVY